MEADAGKLQLPTLSARMFKARGFSIILGLLIMAAFADVVFGWRTFFYRDFGIFGYPLAFHHRESFWNGEIPLWNPYNNSGIPFLAQWNTMVLYPGSLFYVLFPLSWSLGVFCLLHLFWAGLGMHRLIEHWTGHQFAACLAGVAFAFNGLTLSCLKWPNNIAALAWMPWVVLLVERAGQRGGWWIWWAALAAGMQILTGGPEIILFTWLIAGVLWVADLVRSAGMRDAARKENEPSRDVNAVLLTLRKKSALPVVALLATAIAAAQLLPFIELLRNSQRGAAYGDASWSMPWWGPANFLFPLFRCFPSHHGVFAQPGQYWISSYYAGVVVVLAAALALWLRPREIRIWTLSGVAVICLLLSFGPDGFLYAWLREYVTPIQIIRFPIKFVVPIVFALPVLAALAIASMDRTPACATRLLVVAGLVCLVLMGGILVFERRHFIGADEPAVAWGNALYRMLSLALGVGLLIAMIRQPMAKTKTLISAGVLAAVWLDLITQAPRLTPTIERWVYEPDLASAKLSLDPAPRLGHSRAMLSPWADFRMNHLALTNAVDDYLYSRFSFFANVNLLDRVPKVDGFFSLMLEEENRVRYLLYSSTNSMHPPLQDFLGVSQGTAPGKMIEWQARTNFLPLASAGQKPTFLDGPDTLRAMADPAFDPAKTVFLEPSARTKSASGIRPAEDSESAASAAAPPEVTISKLKAGFLELEVKSVEDSWVVVSQTYYHPWRAYVNGIETPLHRANHAFQAVAVPAGSSRIGFVYHDRAFKSGACVSVAALGICGIGFFRCAKKHGFAPQNRITAS